MTLLKLHLRDFFWFAVILAMGLGWWLDRSDLSRRLENVTLKLDRLLTDEDVDKMTRWYYGMNGATPSLPPSITEEDIERITKWHGEMENE